MRRLLLAPTWWLRHLLAVGLMVSFVLLGKWQMTKALSPSGTLTNFAYALQWWAFIGVVGWAWWDLARDEIHPKPPREPLPDDIDYPDEIDSGSTTR